MIECLEGMMGEAAFILPSIEALSNLCLTPQQQVLRAHHARNHLRPDPQRC